MCLAVAACFCLSRRALSFIAVSWGALTAKKRETGFPVPLGMGRIFAQSRISISLPQQTGMGSPALICSVRLQT